MNLSVNLSADHNKNPHISVVIPLYNKGKFINRSITSILNQTIQDFEIIVVDDGSTDDGGRIVSRINDQRVRLLTQENQGVASTRNRGIKEANADLIAFQDADDEWENEFIETILRLSNEFPQAGAYATSYQIISSEGKTRLPLVSGPSIPKFWQGILQNYYLITHNEHPFCASSIVVRKPVFEDIGGFLEGVNLGEDLEMWLRTAISYPIAFSNSPQAIYHQEAENRACNSHYYPGEVPLAISARTAIKQGKVPIESQQDLLEMVARQQLFPVQHRLLEGDKQTASTILISISYTKLYRRHWLWWRFWSVMPSSFFLFSRRVIEWIRSYVVN